MTTRTKEELSNAIPLIAASPAEGVIEMLVVRPESGERREVAEAELNGDVGMVGDCWRTKGSSKTPDGSAHPDAQVTIMNSRAVQAIAGSRDQWALAGDQIYVDMDLSAENLPAGTQLAVGTAVLEVTDKPHTGCAKFRDRFGQPAALWVNSDEGVSVKARGINARVLKAGSVRAGETITKL